MKKERSYETSNKHLKIMCFRAVDSYGGQNTEMGSLWLRFGSHLSQTVHMQAQHVPHVSIRRVGALTV